jgi:hypothetical protein
MKALHTDIRYDIIAIYFTSHIPIQSVKVHFAIEKTTLNCPTFITN